jgi:transglutaminase-like putative cysteine protease
MTATGYTEGNTVHFTLDTGQATITDKVILPNPPILAVNDRSYLLDQLNKPGQKMKIPSFDPLSLTGRESIIKYNGQKKLLIRRRIKKLHHFTETFSGMRVNFWLDDKGRVVKEESPAGFQLIAEPEFRARDVVSSGNELLSAVAVPLTGKLPGPGTTEITYRVTLPADLDFDTSGGRQAIKEDLLTIKLEKIPATSSPDNNPCSRPQSLLASRYVQSDHEDIKNNALNIVGEQQDQAKQVRLLADWVYNSLEKRPVLGLPDALTTLRSMKGDCNEHASLFAALARSLDIPTVIATGVTLMNNAFYYHAWNEVCLDGEWYSLDTTTNQFPADLFHIRFGWGDLDQQLKIGGLLGNLEIEIIQQENN